MLCSIYSYDSVTDPPSAKGKEVTICCTILCIRNSLMKAGICTTIVQPSYKEQNERPAEFSVARSGDETTPLWSGHFYCYNGSH